MRTPLSQTTFDGFPGIAHVSVALRLCLGLLLRSRDCFAAAKYSRSDQQWLSYGSWSSSSSQSAHRWGAATGQAGNQPLRSIARSTAGRTGRTAPAVRVRHRPLTQ